MGEIRRIKLAVNILDDEKIKLIRSMPEGDSILAVWIELLCLAGKTNDGGAVYIGQGIYYTDEMLATVSSEPVGTIRLAMKTFEEFEMISRQDGLITIENREKHQNIDGMERVREQTRKRVAKHRAKQKELKELEALEEAEEEEDPEENVTLQSRYVTQQNKNKNKNKNKRESKSSSSSFSPSFVGEVVEKWNSLDSNIPRLKSLKAGTSRYSNLKARVNEYGEEAVLEAIENINHSRFLQGYVKARTVNFDWFVRPNNFLKVYEGNYADEDFKQEQKEAELNREPTLEEINEALRGMGMEELEE